ncbi:MAG: substrate-binding domain-containing protein, partial [Spirochaetales bacterium]|nr:substrate-binding domain-containing protein [Spirochaetales bacterium]
GCSNFYERAIAFESAIRKLDLHFSQDSIYTLRSTQSGSFEDMTEILINNKDNFPSALFACNDMVAIGAIQAMQASGIKVPEDVSIIGFDDLPASTVLMPPLTSMSVPKLEIGKTAVRTLLEKTKLESQYSGTQKILLGGSLIERRSVLKK